jgi:hypothetical protein
VQQARAVLGIVGEQRHFQRMLQDQQGFRRAAPPTWRTKPQMQRALRATKQAAQLARREESAELVIDQLERRRAKGADCSAPPP